MTKTSLEEVSLWLASQDFCVLATSDPSGQPHCSLMSPALGPDGRCIYLLTLGGTRKHRNLEANPRVSLLFDDRGSARNVDELRALSVTGLAQAVSDAPERGKALELLLTRHSHLQPLAADPRCLAVKVRPIRLQMLTGPTQVEVFELPQV